MSITLKKMDNPYSDEVFSLMKFGLYPFVNEVFGWEDSSQKERLKEDYKPEWFYWVLVEGKKAGFICYKRYEEGLHLHLIVIAEQYQGSGIGKKVMAEIQDIAFNEQRSVTLSSFKCNERAVNLYKSLGYEITSEEEYFLLFRLSHNNHGQWTKKHPPLP